LTGGGGSAKKLGPLGDELSYAQSDTTGATPHVGDLQLDIPPNPDHWHSGGYVAKGEDELEDEDEHHGMLPEWLSTSNLRMRSLLVVSAALIVGSLVMAVVALGANSDWWTTTEGGEEDSNRASFVFDVSENGGDMVGEVTGVPSFAPSVLSLPTLEPISVEAVSDETGENDVLDMTTTEATAATEATTTTTEAASEDTSTVSTMTDEEIMAEAIAALKATQAPTTAPIVSPTVSPSVAPVTNTPTTCKY
jgi:hypothetical protein